MIRIHIDEIVLHGVDPGDPVAFRAAVEAELTRLVSTHDGALSAGRAYELHGTAVSTGDGLARDVARSAFHSIVPETPRGRQTHVD